MDSQPAATTQRVIRVFVSSTFKDMQAEREELVKRIFPQLRKLCEKRGVTWGEVDLRWGITDEQMAEGKVLPVCLAEIQRCRPYFIGLLGERYGWVPDEIPQGLVRQEEWLKEHLERSVTELEILHGVLRNTAMADHALFYFRDPSFIHSLPVDQQKDFQELPTDDEIAKYGQQEAERRAGERRQKLAALKARIGSSGLPVRENYANPRDLGELILEDLIAIIDQLFPEGSQPDPLDQEAAEHEAFAKSRTGVYIGRQEYFDRLNAHIHGDGPPLVVLGDSGSGKSALLAKWAEDTRSELPQDADSSKSLWIRATRFFGVHSKRDGQHLTIMHFIGATPYSSDWTAMLRRIMGEFKRRFDIKGEIPDQPDALRSAFANWLHMAAAKGRVVLILDALNQLEDREGAPDLVWLPPVIPANVRMILSTLPGRPLDELKKRGWPTLEVKSLDVDERKELIAKYLVQYTKELSGKFVDRIANARQTANPLYLRALLEELRLYGDHLTLEKRIEHYLAAIEIDDLYEKILERYEQDYERDRPGLVRDAVSLIWAARRGLSEEELLELLGSNGNRLPRAFWSPLYLAAEQSLVSRSGLINFFHDYLSKAVHDRYVPSEQEQAEAHLRLAKYFNEIQEHTSRKIDELPWQLAEAKEWRRLYDLLTDLEFFDASWNMNEFDVKAHWAQTEAHSTLQMVDAYRPVLDSPARFSSYVWGVATLLQETGHPMEASSLREYLVDHYRQTGDINNLQASLGNQALILQARGELDAAMALLKEQERICRELGNKNELQASLGNQALILKARGELDAAMALLKEQERICRELGNKNELQASLGNQAGILQDRGELDAAMALHKEQERICRELGNKDGLQMSLGNQALILQARGELDAAMALLKEQERICRELGNKNDLQASLGNQALILKARGELDAAMALHKEQERICRELGNKNSLGISLGSQALILQDRGEPDVAMALLKEEERICRELGNKDGLQASLGNQAVILKARGELDAAMALHKEQERICRELGNKNDLGISLGNQALILQARGELDAAMALLKEQERICRELGNKDGLQASLGNQAVILQDRGELDAAIALHKEQERICRELGNKNGLQMSLGNQAVILQDRGEPDAAMALLKEQERICRELGNKDDLRISLGNQAVILKARGELDAAMALLKEQERICRELGNKDSLQISLGNQALILKARGELDAAMALLKEEERICRELGNKDSLQASLGNQALILKARGELDAAMALLKEGERICRELGNKDNLQISLGNQALILKARGELDAAMALHKEQERICRELGNKNDLQISLANQAAIILNARGELDAAMPLLKEQERICRELGNKNGLQASLGNQALILHARGELDAAMALLKEQERICRELRNNQSLATGLTHQAWLLGQVMGRPRDALPLAEEAYRLAADHGLTAVAQQIKPILDSVRSRVR